MSLISNEWAVDIYRNIPSESFIQSVVLWSRREVFISSYYVCDAHEVIVNNICKIICRESVRLDEYHVVELFIWNCDISVKLIVEGCLTCCRIVLSDNVRLSGCKIRLDLFLAEIKTMLVITCNFLACDLCLKRSKSLLVAEAVISLSFSISFLAYSR